MSTCVMLFLARTPPDGVVVFECGAYCAHVWPGGWTRWSHGGPMANDELKTRAVVRYGQSDALVEWCMGVASFFVQRNVVVHGADVWASAPNPPASVVDAFARTPRMSDVVHGFA